MKKAKRILSILLALTMLLGTVSVFGSAYTAYRDSSIVYNDVDKPKFNVNQYASMALDELDRMLAEEQIVLDISLLTLDLTSVDATLASVANVFNTLGTLTSLVGDVQNLNVNALRVGSVSTGDPLARLTATGGNTEDYAILEALLKFLNDNVSTILVPYVTNALDLGIANALAGDYLFNVRELATGALYGLIAPDDADYDYFEDGAADIPSKYNADGTNSTITNGTDVLLQDVLNHFILGEWVCLDEYFTENGKALLDDKGDPVLNENDEQVYVKRYFEDYFPTQSHETDMDLDGHDYYGWFHEDAWVTVLLGGTAVVAQNAAAPAPIYTWVDINSGTIAYDFIENLMQRAYNYIAVPELNRSTTDWLRRECGVTYLDSKTDTSSPTYDYYYHGEEYTSADLKSWAGIFNLDMQIPMATVPTGSTFVQSFGNICGRFVEAVLTHDANPVTANNITTYTVDNETAWTWHYSASGINNSNDYLFDNIVSVAKYVLKETGSGLFADYVEVATDAEVDAMSNQETVAYVLRSILNASIDWLFIPNDANNQTVAGVAYTICEQLAWQDIPQYSYTRPVKGEMSNEAYYDALVEACLNILLDVAVYNLNQNMDMVPAVDGTDASSATANGLLQYTHDYKTIVLQIVVWALQNYSTILNPDYFTLECYDEDGEVGNKTINNVWADIDSIVNAIVPIEGSDAWLNSALTSGTYVIKDLLFNNIVSALTDLNPAPLAAIFEKNPGCAFAEDTVKQVAMTLITNIVNNLLITGFFSTYENFDAVLRNNILGGFVSSLITEIYERREAVLFLALPIVCDALGLSKSQEFKEIEVYLPDIINANDGSYTFAVYNGSEGLNTAYRLAGVAAHTRDNLYKYDIDTVVPKVNNGTTGAAVNNHGIVVTGISAATNIYGGQSVTATIGGNLSGNIGNIVELQITYDVYGEDNTALTDQTLSSSTFAYISNADGGDDVVKVEESVGSNTIKYNSDIYLDRGSKLSSLEGYSIEIDTPSATSYSLNSVTVSGGTNFVTANLKSETTAANGKYFVNPIQIATFGADGEEYSRVEAEYTKNDPVNPDPDFESVFTGYSDEVGQIPNGEYTVTSNFTIDGTPKTVTTRVHLYDDFDLDSAYNNAVSTNRQSSDYDMEKNEGAAADLFTAYQVALRNASNLVLRNKNGATFASSLTANIGTYENIYQKYYEELDTAIENLKEYQKSAGFTALRSLIASFSGYNYAYTETTENGATVYQKVVQDAETGRTNLEYNETGYTFFGMRDFVPHTYSRFKDARNHAQSLIDSQMIFKPIAPVNPGANATASELREYNDAVISYEDALETYNKQIEDMAALSAIDAVYAQHMVELTGDRLIYLRADISKLQAVYNMYNNTNGTAHNLVTTTNSNNYYLASRWEDYTDAVEFAAATLALSPSANDIAGNPVLRPSRVNEALTNLVHAWKRLAKGADKVDLENAINSANAQINAAGFYTTYTTASTDALVVARDNALDLFNAELAESPANISGIARAISDIEYAIEHLEEAAAPEPVYTIQAPANAIFNDPTWMTSYSPTVNTFFEGCYNMGIFEEESTRAFLTGFSLLMDSSYFPTTGPDALFSLQNAYMEVVPTANGYGTGTEILIKSSADDSLVYTYYVVLLGDVTGDGDSNNTDAGVLSFAAAGYYDWVWTDMTLQCYACAGDLNLDGYIDGVDSNRFKFIATGSKYIEQQGNFEIMDY